MLGQAMFVFRLSNTAVYLSNSLAQQMATYVIWKVADFMSKSQQTTIHSKTYSFGWNIYDSKWVVTPNHIK